MTWVVWDGPQVQPRGANVKISLVFKMFLEVMCFQCVSFIFQRDFFFFDDVQNRIIFSSDCGRST